MEPIVGSFSDKEDHSDSWIDGGQVPTSKADLEAEALLKGNAPQKTGVSDIPESPVTEVQPDPHRQEPSGHVAEVMSYRKAMEAAQGAEEELRKSQAIGGEGYQPTGDPEADRTATTVETIQAFHQVADTVSTEDDEPEDSVTRTAEMVAREDKDHYQDWWTRKSAQTKGLDALNASLEKATPVGGTTPGGYKKVAPGQYVKEGPKKEGAKKTSGSSKHQPGEQAYDMRGNPVTEAESVAISSALVSVKRDGKFVSIPRKTSGSSAPKAGETARYRGTDVKVLGPGKDFGGKPTVKVQFGSGRTEELFHDELGVRKSMEGLDSLAKAIDEPLEKFFGFGGGKGGGEGSKGGKVIGHDAHGKPIYDRGSGSVGMTGGGKHIKGHGDHNKAAKTGHPSDKFRSDHSEWASHDHKDAAHVHGELANKTKDKKAKKRHSMISAAHDKVATGKADDERKAHGGKIKVASRKDKKASAKAWDDHNEEAKKSMSGIEAMTDFLEKSGAMAEGDTTNLDQSKSGTIGASAGGGEVAGVGETSGGMPAAPGPGQDAEGQLKGVKSGKDQKLSEDDAEVDGQMSPHKKPIETTKKSSMPADQRDSVAHANAVHASRLRKAADERLSADDQAADLVKSTGFYFGGAPQLNLHQDVNITSVQECASCEATFSKSLSACPDCGDGTITSRPMPNMPHIGQPSGLSEDPSQGMLRKSRATEDVCIGGPVQPITMVSHGGVTRRG